MFSRHRVRREEKMAVGRTPDTFGLQEYFISEVETEIIGHDVRIICGVKRGGETHWLYSCVMPADLLLVATRKVTLAAEDAFNASQIVDRRVAH
jgi:hypothetical protein